MTSSPPFPSFRLRFCNAMLLFLGNKLTSRLSPWDTAFAISLSRLLSTPTTHDHESPPPTSEFAVQYLINSCGLPSDKAVRASRYISHLKSPEKPDAVLQFLRGAAVTQPHIRAAALRQPSFLGYSVDKCFKPTMADLIQLGFSPSHISLLLSICPTCHKRSSSGCKLRSLSMSFCSS